MRIAREMMKSHNVQQLPALQNTGLLSPCKADCGASAAASLSSLLDKVLTEHASTVPLRKELVARQHQRAAAAVKSVKGQLQPDRMRARCKSVSGSVSDKHVDTDAAAAGPKRNMRDISEGEEDKAMEWWDGAESLHQCEGVTIKSRTRSRRGNMAGQRPCVFCGPTAPAPFVLICLCTDHDAHVLIHPQAWTSFALRSDRGQGA